MPRQSEDFAAQPEGDTLLQTFSDQYPTTLPPYPDTIQATLPGKSKGSAT